MPIAKTALVSGLLLIGLPSLAQAQWYVGADAGANFTDKSKVHDAPGTSNLDTSFFGGGVGLGQVGYDFGQPKVEFELGYRDNEIHKIGGERSGGDVGASSAMVNGLYDFTPASIWHPYLGGGIGVAHIKANDVQQAAFSGEDTKFAYQGIAGLGYDLNDKWRLKAEYRYFSAQYPTNNADGQRIKDSYVNQSALIGITYRFSEPKPVHMAQKAAEPAPPLPPQPQPVVTPLPPPQPVVQPVKNFELFFDFDKSYISPAATVVIDQVVAQSNGVTRINVTGYTDLSGSEAYNMALSLRRANAVKESLVRKGVPEAEIVVVGKGKSDPLVPTADGVREPQNRRVEIIPQ